MLKFKYHQEELNSHQAQRKIAFLVMVCTHNLRIVIIATMYFVAAICLHKK